MAAAYRYERAGDLEVLRFPVFDGHPVDILVTTRHGGVSRGPYESLNLGLHVGDDAGAVVENRRRAAAALGLALADLVFCNQTHGRAVVEVTEADRGRGATSTVTAVDGVDALVTRTPGIGIVEMMADCTPIALYDPTMHTVGCVHAGWRGATAGVAAAAVEAMVAGGSDPSDVLAAVGPTVDPGGYQVGPEVAEAATAALGAAAGDVLRPDGTGRWVLDLWAVNRRVLCDAGVSEEHVVVADVPTGRDGPFFSDRQVRPCGRFAVMARLREAAS